MKRKIFLPRAPVSPTRRRVMQTGLWLAGCLALPRASLAATRSLTAAEYPFSLGVASGYPLTNAVILWTRVAPTPLAPDGGMPPVTVPVTWEIATDERMRDLKGSGIAYASPEWAHSVHVEAAGLEPDRPYWYRFRALGTESPIGRTWTAPAADSQRARLRLALVSCQHYEHGYYTAYRQMLEDQPELVVHVGDYIYEGGRAPDPVRMHNGGEAHTLEDYRIRHALYRLDTDLQAAHAAAPWLCTWDDHEVDNDYASDVSEQDDDPELFRQRRAAAMRAYYEHLPLPRSAVPFGSVMRLYQQRNFGTLASFYMLDGRQYRSAHACSAPGQRGARRVSECPELENVERTMLGERQEAWLAARLANTRSRWNCLAQGVMMTHLDEEAGPARTYWTDSWNGYPAARARLLDTLAEKNVSGAVVLSGDVHAFAAARIHAHADRLDTPVAANEVVTTSISSRPPGEEMIKALLANNPNFIFGTGLHRGYSRIDITHEQLRADFVAVDASKQHAAKGTVVRSFSIAHGQRIESF